VAPSDDGGEPITGYVVVFLGSDGATGYASNECDENDDSLVATSVCTFAITTFIGNPDYLAEGDLIQFSVAAINSIGQGEFSLYNTEGPVVSTLPSKLPSAVTSNSGMNIVVTWETPTDTAAPITGYIVAFPQAVITMPGLASEVILLDTADSSSLFDNTGI